METGLEAWQRSFPSVSLGCTHPWSYPSFIAFGPGKVEESISTVCKCINLTWESLQRLSKTSYGFGSANLEAKETVQWARCMPCMQLAPNFPHELHQELSRHTEPAMSPICVWPQNKANKERSKHLKVSLHFDAGYSSSQTSPPSTYYDLICFERTWRTLVLQVSRSNIWYCIFSLLGWLVY